MPNLDNLTWTWVRRTYGRRVHAVLTGDLHEGVSKAVCGAIHARWNWHTAPADYPRCKECVRMLDRGGE